MIKQRTRKLLAISTALFLVIFASMLTYAMVLYFNDRQAGPATTSIAVSKPAGPREVRDITTNDDGNLLITYTDGSTQNAGRVVGNNGQDGVGQVPSQAQLSAALLEYCSNSRCDAKSPTQDQIFSAITAYCQGGVCKGSDAIPVTVEQILNAVNSYCSDGRCRGTIGPTGAQGENTIMACVIRTVNDVKGNYVSWKYASEPDAAYRDLYKLATWAECSSPIDLRTP